MDRITGEFKNGTPIKEIAKKLGISEVKVTDYRRTVAQCYK